MKKIELHVHLDGSVRIETAAEILKTSYEDAKINMQGKNLKSLNEYLLKFDYPLRCMQSYDNIKRIAKELTEDLIEDDVCYAEVRFAPILHQNNLSLEQVIDAVLEGTRSDKIEINLILCMMRGRNIEDNLKIIDLYNYDDRIVGLDLAGAEALFPNDLYFDLFKKINDLKIPFTIHSGEANGHESIDKAILMNAKRIGHGIRAIENDLTITNLIKNDILLEVCPTSNVDTFTIKEYKDCPIYELFKRGVRVCVNTDDRTVSNITLEEEYKKLKNTFNFSNDDFFKMNVWALEHSFCRDKEKILKILKSSFKSINK